MEQLIWRSLELSVRLLLWAVLVPFVVAREVYHATARMAGAWVLAMHDALPCPGCHAPISLVGRWECGRCRFAFDGFAFTRCAVCGAVPPYIPCQRCGVGLRNPTHVRASHQQ
jgi:hypothetical protein